MHFSILIIIILGGIGLAFYQYSAATITKEILDYSSQLVDLKRQTIDSFFSRIENNLRTISSNNSVISIMKDDTRDNYAQQLSNDRRISEFLLGIQKFHHEIRDLIILNDQGKVRFFTNDSIRSDFDFDKQDWFPRGQASYSHIQFIGSHSHDYYYRSDVDGKGIISAVIPIIDYMNPARTHLGTVLCNLDLHKVESLHIPLGIAKKSSLLVLDENQKIIFSTLQEINEDLLYRELVDRAGNLEKGHFFIKQKHHNMAAVYSTSHSTNWKIVVVSPTEELLNYQKNIRSFTIIIMILGFLSVVFISVIISRSISAPILTIMHKMEKVETGDFNVRLTNNSYIEIEKLSSRIELMVDRINRLTHDVFSWELTNKDTEIRALLSQINPHFLFNTLQLIKSLAICGKNEEMSNVVTIMGNMLRYTTYETGSLVTIDRELKHVQDYMQIQDYRYPGKFLLEINCPLSLYKCKVPKFILQPLVENSVCHGFYETNEGNIRISVRDNSDGIEIIVKDDGAGITPEKLNIVVEHLKNHREIDRNKNIGLKNVYDRIRLKYDLPYGLKLKSDINKGFTVLISIPKQGEPACESYIH